MENLTSKYLINGPNNVIRLTDGNKILYIFGDYHLDAQWQRECPIDDEYDSIDIDKLLLKFIKTEKDREFDLFIEWDNLNPELNNVYRKRYIDQVYKLFNSKILLKKNQIVSNKNFSNFRFHYFDIRNSIKMIDDLLYDYSYSKLELPDNLYAIDNIVQMNNKLITNLKLLMEYLNSNENHYINKIKNEYSNLKVKKIMNKLLKSLIFDNIKLAINNTIKINEYINKNIKIFKNILTKLEIRIRIESDIYLKMFKNKGLISEICVVLTDLYFIRRFITKDYIKNGIIYTGASHMSDITYILTKYFNFKITNIFHKHNNFNLKIIPKLKTTNLDYINDMYINLDQLDDYLQPIQCVNLFNFPPNFS
jgi:hypothetical protein